MTFSIKDFFNLRGSDLRSPPVFFAYTIITHNEVILFTDPTKITTKIRDHFNTNNVQVTFKGYDQIFAAVEQLGKDTDGKVWLSSTSSQALMDLVPNTKRYQNFSPIGIMKVMKNDVEAKGMQDSHVRDGVAIVKYFAWLENEVVNRQTVTEISGAAKLLEFRSEGEHFQGVSFGTISASGPNGSIIHYGPSEATNRNITLDEMYLCDSGAQYLDGTTDVTRTWHFGNPTDFMKDSFTRVFKGQWQVGQQVFPFKLQGNSLDSLARKFLWDNGLDYGHGTGHGIGAYLNIHEGKTEDFLIVF